jgi:hypothetical protein
MTLDLVTAAARRQLTLDTIAAELVGWGCPPDYAPDRARHLLDVVALYGYALPTALADVPATRGPGSTDEGRARARQLFADARRHLDDAHAIVDGILDRQGTANRPHVAAERPAPPPEGDRPEDPVPSRDGSADQARSCRWAHGVAVAGTLDEHGLCPICAADEVR